MRGGDPVGFIIERFRPGDQLAFSFNLSRRVNRCTSLYPAMDERGRRRVQIRGAFFVSCSRQNAEAQLSAWNIKYQRSRSKKACASSGAAHEVRDRASQVAQLRATLACWSIKFAHQQVYSFTLGSQRPSILRRLNFGSTAAGGAAFVASAAAAVAPITSVSALSKSRVTSS